MQWAGTQHDALQLPPEGKRQCGCALRLPSWGIIKTESLTKDAVMFFKPKHTQPTRYLFVGNCGTAVGLNEEIVKSFFDHLGAVDVIFPTEGKPSSHIFAVFNDKEDSEIALSRLNGQPCQELGDRILAAKYADVKEDKVLMVRQLFASVSDTLPCLWPSRSCLGLFCRRWKSSPYV